MAGLSVSVGIASTVGNRNRGVSAPARRIPDGRTLTTAAVTGGGTDMIVDQMSAAHSGHSDNGLSEQWN